MDDASRALSGPDNSERDWYHIDTIKHVGYIAVLGAFALGLLAGWWFL